MLGENTPITKLNKVGVMLRKLDVSRLTELDAKEKKPPSSRVKDWLGNEPRPRL